MNQLFRSKTCGLRNRSKDFDSNPNSPYSSNSHKNEEQEEDKYDDEEEEYEEERENEYYRMNPISTPLIVPEESTERKNENNQQFQILTICVAALRKSVATCGVNKEEFCSIDISPPTNVKHVSHVTFDRFNGLLGLPVEFKPKVPTRVPSASSSVFGVSAESMKCSYDSPHDAKALVLGRGSSKEYVRDQLNGGTVKHGIDVHCLAGLIKSSLVAFSSSFSSNCILIITIMKPVSMTFSPTSKMADPLTALIHAVQVMNFLRAIVMKTVRERKEFGFESGELSSCSELAEISDLYPSLLDSETGEVSCKRTTRDTICHSSYSGDLLHLNPRNRQTSTHVKCQIRTTENGYKDDTRDAECFLDRLSLRKRGEETSSAPCVSVE
ncbi:hypothetical protein MKX01_007338 [Papaver californicum]|nr:hypothetical protein MKX01_007338 [Papaver californicum]